MALFHFCSFIAVYLVAKVHLRNAVTEAPASRAERTWLPVIVFLVLLCRQKDQPRAVGAAAKKELTMAAFR